MVVDLNSGLPRTNPASEQHICYYSIFLIIVYYDRVSPCTGVVIKCIVLYYNLYKSNA